MPKTETILVTGGAGFIGSNLCHFLIDKAFNVVCLDNFDDFYSEEIKRNNVKNLLNNQLFEFIKAIFGTAFCWTTFFQNIKLIL